MLFYNYHVLTCPQPSKRETNCDEQVFFPECVAKGSRFTLCGGLGVEVCSLDGVLVSATVSNRPQPSATVRNGPRAKVALPVGKVAKDVIFVACFVQNAVAGLREVVTKCKLRGRRGIL